MRHLSTFLYFSLLIVLAYGMKIRSSSKSSLKYEPWNPQEKEPFLKNVKSFTNQIESQTNVIFDSSQDYRRNGIPLENFYIFS